MHVPVPVPVSGIMTPLEEPLPPLPPPLLPPLPQPPPLLLLLAYGIERPSVKRSDVIMQCCP